MAEEQLNNQATSPVTQAPATGVGAPLPALPADYDELKQYKQAYLEMTQQLEPVADKVRKLVEDPEFSGYVDSSYDTYQRLRQSTKPQLGPEWNPDNNPMLSKIDRVDKFVDTLQKEREQEQKSRTQAWLAAGHDYAGRLQAENPSLANTLAAENGYWAQQIMNRSIARNQSFEDGVKEFVTSFGVTGTAPRTPPPSLQPGAAIANVTETSEPKEQKRGQPLSSAERRARMAAVIAAEQKKVS